MASKKAHRIGVPQRQRLGNRKWLVDRPVTNFAIAYDKPMHLIVVRRDLSGHQHLHPTMAADGTWQVGLTLPAPSVWCGYTDVAALDATGAQVAVKLGVDRRSPVGL